MHLAIFVDYLADDSDVLVEDSLEDEDVNPMVLSATKVLANEIVKIGNNYRRLYAQLSFFLSIYHFAKRRKQNLFD